MSSITYQPIGRLRRLTGQPGHRGLFWWAGVGPMFCIGGELLKHGLLIAAGPFAVAIIWRTQAQMEATE